MGIPRILAAILVAAGLSAPAAAQAPAPAFPARLVKIIVPFPAGGGVDVFIRAVAAELPARWGQPVIVENKVGGNSQVGAGEVARAAPDGHTLLATVNLTMTSNRFMYKQLSYDPERSFAPVIEMTQSDQLVVASSAVPAKDLREFVALAKREPAKYNFGSFGAGTQPHLLFALLNQKEGLDMVHVPYKGIAQLMTALAGGEVAVTTGSGAVAGGLMQQGRVKALAIASPRRAAQFPDVPTVAELGYPYLSASIWFGLFAPAGTPPAVVDKINADVRAILADPAFAERNATSKNLRVVAGTPAQFQQTIRDEVASMGEMIKAAGVQPE